MKKIPLRLSSLLSLLTCLAHTAGTFMPVPPEQKAVANAVQVMKNTLVPMPTGVQQSYADIFLGTNLIVSLLLLISSIVFWLAANADRSVPFVKKIAVVHAIAMLAVSAISGLFFFPVPAVFTGIAGAIAFWQSIRQ